MTAPCTGFPLPPTIWPVAQQLAGAQRKGRYVPESSAHPGKMLPAIAREAVIRLTVPGDLVVDLGAAPGGWLQVAARYVRPNGKVVGVDLQPLAVLHEPNVTFLQGDVMSEEIEQKIKEVLGGAAQCLLSDLAPRLIFCRAGRAVFHESHQSRRC